MKKKLTKEEKQTLKKKNKEHRSMMFKKLRNKEPKDPTYKKPKSFIARKLGVGVIWFTIGFMLLFMVVNLNNKPEAEAIKPQVVKQEVNSSAKPEAIQFGQDFTRQYFSWKLGEEGKKQREDALAKFLGKGLDPFAGLDMNSLKSEAAFQGANLKRVEETGKNQTKMTFLVWYKVKATEQPDSKDEKDKKEEKPTEKDVFKYFVVPVAYNGTSYGVYEIPTFTSLDEKTTLQVNQKNELEKSHNPEREKEIQNFLNTFFSSYATDGKDKLSYILEDKKHANGLQNSLKFVSVEQSDVYQGKKDNEYIVDAKVRFEEPDSKSQLLSNYRLTVEKKQKQFVVTQIK